MFFGWVHIYQQLNLLSDVKNNFLHQFHSATFQTNSTFKPLQVLSIPGALRMVLNCASVKCIIVTFVRKRFLLVYDYASNGSTIERRNCVIVLVVLLDKKFSFRDQLEHVVAKGNQLIGCLKQVGRDITDPVYIKALYCAKGRWALLGLESSRQRHCNA